MEWMTTFATSLPARNHVNDCLLLYSGNNHYDSIIDATFGRCYLASLVVSDDVAGRDVGVSSPDSSGCVKIRRVFYQSIIETRRGRKTQTRIETLSVQRKVDFHQRALNATRRLLFVAKPFQYYGEGLSLDILDSNGQAKEMPIVLVKMDDNIGMSICSTMSNVTPFGEMCDEFVK